MTGRAIGASVSDSDVTRNDTAELDALLLRCARRDRSALQELYARQAARLKGIALRITGNAAAAEDVLHDVFVRVWNEAAAHDPSRGNAIAWLIAMTRYRALDFRRRLARESGSDGLPEQIDDSPNALALLAASSEGAALHRCLTALDIGPRRMITLAFVDGLTHRELADTLGAPLGTVKSVIRRGLLALKACLER